MTRKHVRIMMLAALLSAGTMFTAYAAEKEITSVSLSFSWDKAPKGGDVVGSIYAVSGSSEFTVEGASYLEDDDTWVFGSKPEAEVELSARDGYHFTSTNRRIFSLSGCSAQFKKASIDDDGNTMVLQVSFPAIDSTLPVTTSTSWNGSSAVWDEVGGADSYEVKLYRNNSLLTTATTSGTSYDFSSYINLEGSYTFTVRTLGDYTTQASSWSSASEAKVLSREDAWLCSNGAWEKTYSGWRYVYKNDAYPVNTWRLVNDKWYYFDHSGYMAENCYVTSADGTVYYWVGQDGAWEPQWDTGTPDRAAYEVLR